MLTDILAQLRACRWVDLTHAFEPGIPHYHGLPDERRSLLFDFDQDGFRAHAPRTASRTSQAGGWARWSCWSRGAASPRSATT